MSKYYTFSLGVMVLVLLPGITRADYNDVSLDTNAVINVASQNLYVTGTTNVVQSIVVDSGTFTLTMPANSKIMNKSTDKNCLSPNAASSNIST